MITDFLQKELLILNNCTASLTKNELHDKIHKSIIYKDIQMMLDYEKETGLQIYEMNTYSCDISNENYLQEIPPESTFNDIWDVISNYGNIKEINDTYYFVYDNSHNRCIIMRVYPMSSLHVYDWDTYIYNIDMKFSIYIIPHNRTIKRYFSHLDLKYIFNDLLVNIVNATFIHKMAIKIQTNCQNWLWKPICKDGKPGINFKIGWTHISNTQNN